MLKNYQSSDSRGRKSHRDSISWDICSQRKWRRERKENVSVLLREPVQNPGWHNFEIKSSFKPHPEFSLNYITSKVKVKVTQSCPTLCDPMDCIVHGILQVRILEWAALPFSRYLPNPRIKPRSPTLQADSLSAEPQGKPKNNWVKIQYTS